MRLPALTKQILRFGVIGILNTAVDFAVLNTLILIFGLEKDDPYFVFFKIISFILAVINSFLWNKWWVFKKESKINERKNRGFLEFIGVSIMSFFLNIGMAALIYHSGDSLIKGASPILLANIGAVAGTGLSLISNFLGYKFFVFKDKR